MAVVRELARYKLDLVSVQEVRWDKGGTARRRGLYFFLWKKKQKSSIGNRIFCTPQNSIGDKVSLRDTIFDPQSKGTHFGHILCFNRMLSCVKGANAQFLPEEKSGVQYR